MSGGSIEVGTAYISILPETSQLAPGIRAALGQYTNGSQPTQAGQSIGQRLRAGLTNALKGGLFAGAGGAALLGTAGVSMASTIQQADIAFTHMLGSQTKAQAYLAKLQDFAKSTPFEFKDLITSSQTLMGMGVSAKSVIPDLTALGDSVASTGGNATTLNNTILAFGQTMAKGTLDMGNMNQLLQGGVPNALKILASSYHTTTGEMVKMISAGKVQSSQALPLLVKGIEKGTSSTKALGGVMNEQSHTMAGAFSNLADTVSQSMGNAILPLAPMITKGLVGATNILAAVLPKVGSALQGVVSAVKAAVGWVQKWSGVIVPLVAGLGAYVAATKLLELWQLRSAISARAWAGAQSLLNTVMDANPIGLVIAGIAALVVGFVLAYKKSATFRAIVQAALNGVKAAASAVARFFTTTLPAAFDKVKNVAVSAFNGVKKAVSTVFGWAKTFITAEINGWKAIFNTVVSFVRGLGGKIKGAASGMWDGISDAFKAAIDTVIGWWNGFVGHLKIGAVNVGPVHFGGVDLGAGLQIPLLANGGVLTRPTLNIAGEAGPEAVTPLSYLDKRIATVASAASRNGAAQAAPSASVSLDGANFTLLLDDGTPLSGYISDIADDRVAASARMNGQGHW